MLRSAAIYGPNASGKSNLLRGLATLRQLVEDTATKVQEAIQLNNDQLKPPFAWITQKLIVLTTGIGWNPFLSLELLREERGQAQIMQYMRAADIGIDRLELLEEDIAPTSAIELAPGGLRIEAGLPRGAPPPNAK